MLRNLLNKTMLELLKCDKRLCLSPAELYSNWMSKAGNKPIEITNQQALEEPMIRKQFEENIRLVQTHTSKFLKVILKSTGKIP